MVHLRCRRAYIHIYIGKLYVSLANEPYQRDNILPKRPIILRSLLIEATPYLCTSACMKICKGIRIYVYMYVHVYKIICMICGHVYKIISMWIRTFIQMSRLNKHKNVMYAHTHTHTHTHTLSLTHAHKQTHANILTHSLSHTQTHTHRCR